MAGSLHKVRSGYVGWGFNEGSGLSYNRESGESAKAKDSEIQWNGYPLPFGLRICDLPSNVNVPARNKVTDWESVDMDRSEKQQVYIKRKNNGKIYTRN